MQRLIPRRACGACLIGSRANIGRRLFAAIATGAVTVIAIMTEAERQGQPYLFKLRQSKRVKKLILGQHCRPGWERTVEGFEALSTELTLRTWKQARRAVLIRRKLSKNIVVAPNDQHALLVLSLIAPTENMAVYEYILDNSLSQFR